MSLFTLDNGLRVTHSRHDTTAMVAVNVLYDTGARDERPGRTGLAHLFEHMMFGGSEHIPDFDAVLTAAGGENNAFTSTDFTNYYAAAPAQNAETLFCVESDRMLRPRLSQETLDVQRRVVMEEFNQQCLNRPYGDLMHHLLPMIYPSGHPYSWPVIGKTPQHVADATRQDLLEWFDRHYSPSNAVLAVTGNISEADVRRYAEKWFGDIPRRDVAPRHIPVVAPLTVPAVKTVYGNVPATMVVVAWLMDPYGTDAWHAADAITDLLSAGRSARMVHRLLLTANPLFAAADASISGTEHQGMLMMTGRLADEKTDPMKAAEALIAEGRRIVSGGVTAHEMQRLRNSRASLDADARMDYLSYGQRLAAEVLHGEQPDEALGRYMNMEPGLLTATADAIFNRTAPAILIYRPAALRPDAAQNNKG